MKLNELKVGQQYWLRTEMREEAVTFTEYIPRSRKAVVVTGRGLEQEVMLSSLHPLPGKTAAPQPNQNTPRVSRLEILDGVFRRRASACLPIRRIPLAPFDNESKSQRIAGSKDDRISADKHYLAMIYGEWYLGQFQEEWYGWSFDGWANPSYQLDSIEDLYEVDLGVLG